MSKFTVRSGLFIFRVTLSSLRNYRGILPSHPNFFRFLDINTRKSMDIDKNRVKYVSHLTSYGLYNEDV